MGVEVVVRSVRARRAGPVVAAVVTVGVVVGVTVLAQSGVGTPAGPAGRLPADPRSAPVQRLTASADSRAVARLATALGLPGGPGRDDGGWVLRRAAAELRVAATPGNPWTYIRGDAPDLSEPGATLPMAPPTLAARAAARPVLTAVGLGGAAVEVRTVGGTVSVRVDPLVGGLATAGFSTEVAVDADGVAWARGWLGGLSAVQALHRLRASPGPFARGRPCWLLEPGPAREDGRPRRSQRPDRSADGSGQCHRPVAGERSLQAQADPVALPHQRPASQPDRRTERLTRGGVDGSDGVRPAHPQPFGGVEVDPLEQGRVDELDEERLKTLGAGTNTGKATRRRA